MICALMLDTDDSVDFQDNTGTALGRPLSAYPIMAAKSTPMIARIYVVTRSGPVKGVALQYGGIVIDPPQGEAHSAETLLRHGAAQIERELKEEGASLELLVVLLANAPALTRDLLEEGITALQERPQLDSAVSVSPYNRWNPFFARKEGPDGLLVPYVPAQSDIRGDVWFPDWGVTIIRPASLEKAGGPPPTPWLGRSVHPLKQWGGGPVDYHWQVPSMEYWLKKHGSSDLASRMEMQPLPKLQPSPKRG